MGWLASAKEVRIDDARRDWVERTATYFTTYFQWPPVWSRTMAWLMVCDPPEQSAAEIARAIQASRAAMTEPLRALTGYGLLIGGSRPGRKTIYYRMAPDAWRMVLRRRFAALATFTTLTAAGSALFAPADPLGDRVREVHALFAWLNDEIEPLFERWDTRHDRHRAGEEA